MKRPWLLPLALTVAALGGATLPVVACSVADESSGFGGSISTGAPSSTTGGQTAGTGGGPLSDAAVDVVLNNDDPPPFTGKSYCYLCGGGDDCTGLSCDPTSGDCVDSGTSMNGMGCKLVPDTPDAGDAGDDDGGVGSSAACAPAGDGEEFYGCMTSADCKGGFGCTKVNGTAQCLRYCCQSTESCQPGTWCVPEHVVDGTSEGPKVPVCIQASNCSLLDDSAPCPNGLMCTIVRTDGTTACVQQGSGTAGDGCPCAPGYVCSQLADKCFKLCHVGNDLECPDGSKCVGGMGGYPDGIGNCLGGSNN